MGGLALPLLRGASGVLAAGALAKGVDFSTDGHGHEFVTYLAWYGAGAVFVIATVVLSIAIYKRHEAEGALQTPDPCGDPKARRAELTFSAERLETELGQFENWWPAVADKDFDGRLKDGFETTHEEAVQALSYAFAYFFSAAWIYEKQCKGHHGRRRKQVLDLVGEVYWALGANSSGDTDATVNSLKLKTIAERSTRHAGEARAQTMAVSDFNAHLKDNPTFAAHFQPLEKFLIAAGRDSGAEARMAKVKEAVKRAKRKLT